MYACMYLYTSIYIYIVFCMVVSAKINYYVCIKTHDSESRGQEEAGRTRDEQVSYLHVAPL